MWNALGDLIYQLHVPAIICNLAIVCKATGDATKVGNLGNLGDLPPGTPPGPL
jgi:hypothetical protein